MIKTVNFYKRLARERLDKIIELEAKITHLQIKLEIAQDEIESQEVWINERIKKGVDRCPRDANDEPAESLPDGRGHGGE